ncbi:hypothetical protein BC827DRAFT_754855 [Russula dissimulans]|nr:hypothetical protein BC827DRAFT_754855 [Russula dissimulans]
MSQDKQFDIEGRTGQGDPDYDDESGALFSMYSMMAAAEDLWMAERWQKDADGILIFTGLFSAAVAALLAVTIPDLKANPQDTSNFYLQQLKNSSSSSEARPPPFSPPTEVVVVNLFTFLSLFISLSCAVLATVVQQWARQYVRYTQPSQRGPKTRARIRTMFSHSVDRLFIKCISSLLPCYLNLAIFFFLVGMLVYLWYLNRVIFYFTILLFLWSLGVYGFFTLLPFFQHDSLLYTPLSTFPISMLAVFVCLFNVVTRRRFKYSGWGIFDWAFDDVGYKADAIAKRRSPDIDTHVLEWSLRALTDDDAVEKYLQAVPDFFRGPSAPPGPLSDDRKREAEYRTRNKFKQTLCGFLDRTFSSNTVTEDVRNSHLIIGLDASHAALGREETARILEEIRREKWPKLLRSNKMGGLLTRWGDDSDESYRPQIRSIVSHIVPPPTSDSPTSPPGLPILTTQPCLPLPRI